MLTSFAHPRQTMKKSEPVLGKAEVKGSIPFGSTIR
jgi:hypothetical protein